MAKTDTYDAKTFGGKKEMQLLKDFRLQMEDAKLYFTQCIKPRLDRSYKLYMADTTDRAKEIQKWQANVAVPYIHGVVETLKPRILDARPEFVVQGRNEDDQRKAKRLQSLADYTWEISKSDKVAEQITSSALIYGMGHMQVGWKKDKRKHQFLSTKDLSKKKYTWKEKEQVFYDAPTVEWVDNYSLWYDWHNVEAESKQYWFKRLVLTKKEIEVRYPMAEKKRLKVAFEGSGESDLTNYAAVRTNIKLDHERVTKGAAANQIGGGLGENYHETADSSQRMYEVFEWIQPHQDVFAVMVNQVPILKGGFIPNPYDFKEKMFISVPYLLIPGEFEGYGLPMILENPQIMLNMIKNQRLDATTLSIHKMWIVNPMANIDKSELITRPFGIIYSPDPNGAREISMSDIKPSAYREEELLKSDMTYASGVDDFSMAAGGGAGSATEIRHLRESTLERVRLFINHLGDAYADVMRYWISMYQQFGTKEMMIRVIGEDGAEDFPIIERDDLKGEFDFKAAVIPSIAGQNDVKKKQDMDLFQLLIGLPFIDPQKLTSKVLFDWNWSLESLKKGEEQAPPPLPGSPEEAAAMGMEGGAAASPMGARPISGGRVSEDVASGVLSLLGGEYEGEAARQTPFAEAGAPINLLEAGALPPTPRGVRAKGANPRGANRGGKVNTNIPIKSTVSPESTLLNQARSIQR